MPANQQAAEPKPRKPRSLSGFYARAVSEAERAHLEAAAEVEGLDEEIALLRAKLFTALIDRPEDAELFMKGVRLLVTVISARYRLSGDSKDDIVGNLIGLVNGIGIQLFPGEEREDGDAA